MRAFDGVDTRPDKMLMFRNDMQWPQLVRRHKIITWMSTVVRFLGKVYDVFTSKADTLPLVHQTCEANKP